MHLSYCGVYVLAVLRSFVLALALCLAQSALAQDHDELTRDLSRLSMIREPQLSPTGRYLAIQQAANGRYAIVIYDLERDDEHFVWDVPGYDKILSHRWVSEDRLLIETMETIADDGSGRSYVQAHVGQRGGAVGTRVHVQAIDHDGGNPFTIFTWNLPEPIVPGETHVADFIWQLPDYILLSAGTPEGPILYRINVRRPDELSLIDQGNQDTVGWLTDGRGRIRVRIDSRRGRPSIFARPRGISEWRRVYRAPRRPPSSMWPVSMHLNGNTFYVGSNFEGREGLYAFDLRHSEDLERLFLDEIVDMDGPVLDRETGAPLAVAFTRDVQEMAFLDGGYRQLHDRLENVLPGPNVYIPNSAAWANVHVVSSVGPSTPPEFYLLNEEDNSLRPIAAAYPRLEGVQLGHVEAITYHASDGLPIRGYLTFPPDYDGGPLPMIVLPHGGPHYRDAMYFDPLNQIFAARGYLVFQMNFRGSTGFGSAFRLAGFGEWGGLMQSDITDGIDAIIERGLADPDRMCLAGFSYGGYAVMLEAVRHPERFRCVAAIAGVYDLITMLESPQGIAGASTWDYSIGTIEEDREHLEEISPINLLPDPANMPAIFLGHGQRDYTVHVDQTLELIDVLEERGFGFSAQIYPQSDHYFEFEPERMDLYGRLADFMDENLGIDQ